MKLLAITAALGFSLALASAAAAMPAGVPGTSPLIEQVAGGCGFGFHRGPYGGCRRNRAPVVRRACPRGWHLGPYGRRCRPNRY